VLFYFAREAAGALMRPAFPAPSVVQKGDSARNLGAVRAAGMRGCVWDQSLNPNEVVMPGLDPGIHHSQTRFRKKMDGRVKPGHDGIKNRAAVCTQAV
jgi:hypothetical protein